MHTSQFLFHNSISKVLLLVCHHQNPIKKKILQQLENLHENRARLSKLLLNTVEQHSY